MLKEKIKQLERMGYDVLVHPNAETVHVSLKTKTSFGVYFTLFTGEMYKEDIVERIVYEMNKTIRESI